MMRISVIFFIRPEGFSDMPVISFANRKGGSGKTTSALHLACQLARSADVIVIDADPNSPMCKWASKPNPYDKTIQLYRGVEHPLMPNRLTVLKNQGEDEIVDEIEEAASEVPFVIVDLEGIASQRVSNAISLSDLVVIPMQKDQQDADCGIDIIKNLKVIERTSRRTIPFRVLFTRVKAAAEGRTASHIQGQVSDNLGDLVFSTQIIERESLRTVHSTGGALYELDPTSVYKIKDAVANIEAFKTEVIDILRANNEKKHHQEVA